MKQFLQILNLFVQIHDLGLQLVDKLLFVFVFLTDLEVRRFQCFNVLFEMDVLGLHLCEGGWGMIVSGDVEMMILMRWCLIVLSIVEWLQ